MNVDTLLQDLIDHFGNQILSTAQTEEELDFSKKLITRFSTASAKKHIVDSLPVTTLAVLKSRMLLMGARTYPKFLKQIISQLNQQKESLISMACVDQRLTQGQKDFIKRLI